MLTEFLGGVPEMTFDLLLFVALILGSVPTLLSQRPGFISIDCGGAESFVDKVTGLKWISDEAFTTAGKSVKINVTNEIRLHYQSLRFFPADENKYCYKLNTTERLRYLIRATFLYGNFDNSNEYPRFSLSLDTTHWATIMVTNASELYMEEMIFRADSNEINVCVFDASIGSPFISTLELRPLNNSMYATDFEEDYFLKVTERINFGALHMEPVRFPDDPYDRIWNPDAMRPNYLVGVADGTVRINTTRSIDIGSHEQPPNKVMQTAVVGTEGILTYRLNLEDFPANARAYAFLAEIEDLGPNETRKFTMQKPYVPGYSNLVINIRENAGIYSLYEPSFKNISLPFVLSFAFAKTSDSSRGPVLNAIEINRYVKRALKTSNQQLLALLALKNISPKNAWSSEGGDPCLPVQWKWVDCDLDSSPRITKVDLSGKSLEGDLPSDISKLDGLVELKLNNNSFTGSIPDWSALSQLAILHLENNRLQGQLPAFLIQLPKLQELYVQNNQLRGEIPHRLIKKLKVFNYDGNPGLTLARGSDSKKRVKKIIGIVIGALVLLLIVSLSIYCGILRYKKCSSSKDQPLRGHRKNSGKSYKDVGEVAYSFTLAQLEQATAQFSKKIGEGSFGPVYYGKTDDGKEIAVKILAGTSSHGTEQFINEVTLLSRVHHRNLVPLIGYCDEHGQSMLVYEYMHNGTLRDQLHGSNNQMSRLDWISRLLIAEDSAKGMEYLHSGCNPSIIHRDIKSSNILLDVSMRAKVSDFGLSRFADEEKTHFSTAVRGTVGYLDPEYYATQQLTDKSDVYSFGVVLLELISGRKPISSQQYGSDWNIVLWARSSIRKGDIHAIVDPTLENNFKIESVWKIAEIAILSVEPSGFQRPKMHVVLQAIQEAISIEKGNLLEAETQDKTPSHFMGASFLSIPYENANLDSSLSISNNEVLPAAR